MKIFAARESKADFVDNAALQTIILPQSSCVKEQEKRMCSCIFSQ